jgi:hypothetical protein
MVHKAFLYDTKSRTIAYLGGKLCEGFAIPSPAEVCIFCLEESRIQTLIIPFVTTRHMTQVDFGWAWVDAEQGPVILKTRCLAYKFRRALKF